MIFTDVCDVVSREILFPAKRSVGLTVSQEVIHGFAIRINIGCRIVSQSGYHGDQGVLPSEHFAEHM